MVQALPSKPSFSADMPVRGIITRVPGAGFGPSDDFNSGRFGDIPAA